MATYNNLSRKSSTEDSVYLEIADIYLKMGLREEARAQYRILLRQYETSGMRDRALKVIALLAKMDPGKTGLDKKITGFEHLPDLKEKASDIALPQNPDTQEDIGPRMKEPYFDLSAELTKEEPDVPAKHKKIGLVEKVYEIGEIFKRLREVDGPGSLNLNFNFHMGVACREGGLVEEAIEQFRIACNERQNPFEAAHLLGLCLKEKGMWEEARQAFERALQVEGISRENQLAVKCELGVVLKKQGKTEEAFKIVREISASDQRFRNTNDKEVKLEKEKATKK
jgi:tetratricopeptide (TPR) repeat protein